MRSSGVANVVGLFENVLYQKPVTDTEKMQYLKTTLTGPTKAAKLRKGFNSKSYYRAWHILCEKYGRSDVIVNTNFKRIHAHPHTASIVKFSNVVTIMAKIMSKLG